MTFTFLTGSEFPYLCFTPPGADAPSCAFTGKGLDFSAKEEARSILALKNQFGREVVTLSQGHSTEIWDTRLPKPEVADAIITPRTDPVIYGIKTADCMPILVFSDQKVALIHAGWRGLSQGIVSKVIEQLSGSSLSVVIGPSASFVRYEVGQDVFDAFNGVGVFMRVTGHKYLFSLSETAEQQIKSIRPDAVVSISSVCTISDSRFHSHRREGSKSGRNLSFILPGS